MTGWPNTGADNRDPLCKGITSHLVLTCVGIHIATLCIVKCQACDLGDTPVAFPQKAYAYGSINAAVRGNMTKGMLYFEAPLHDFPPPAVG